MGEQSEARDPSEEDSGTAILVVPRALAQQVIDYVSRLAAEEGDVAGYQVYKPRPPKQTTKFPGGVGFGDDGFTTKAHGGDVGATVVVMK